MIKKELFIRNKIENKQRTPQRPLGPVSDFVIETLPQLITAVDENRIEPATLLAHIEDIFLSLDENIIAPLFSLSITQNDNSSEGHVFDQRLDQAAFDLKLLEIALVTYQLPVPEKLTELVNKFSEATHQLPMITYEDLIYINPEIDPRTFTQGEIGDSEYDFYLGHLRIEKVLATVIQHVEEVAKQLEQKTPNVTLIIAMLENAIELFGEAQEDLTAVGMKLPKEHFAVFRKFFNTHPTRELKGPSGAFTSAIPVLDMLLGGENLDSSYFDYLRDNELYFPRSGRYQMANAYKKIEAGKTLTALTNQIGNPPELVNRLQKLSEQIRQFRGQHYKGVRYQIPGAVTGSLVGTGGEMDPGQFLRQRMKMRHIREEQYDA